MDPALLAEMLAEGYIAKHEHPNGDLYGLNYTNSAQFDSVWNDATLNSRGIICDTNDTIVARPFSKFFNLGEQPAKDKHYSYEPFQLFEKFDGSLGIHYRWKGEDWIATRGSFVSNQAQWATEWCRTEQNIEPTENATDLFEIIYPQNRIVVDYGARRGLQFLATIDHGSGRTLRTSEPWDCDKLDDVKTKYEHLDDGNHEGFVALFNDGHRIKIKLDEDVRRHRVKASLSNRTIWELLSNGGCTKEMIELSPDEFHPWIRSTTDDLESRHSHLVEEARQLTADILGRVGSDDRKAFAMEAKQLENPALVFANLDGKDLSPLAWKWVRPETIEYAEW